MRSVCHWDWPVANALSVACTLSPLRPSSVRQNLCHFRGFFSMNTWGLLTHVEINITKPCFLLCKENWGGDLEVKSMVLLHGFHYLASQTGITTPTIAAKTSSLRAVTVSKIGETFLFLMVAHTHQWRKWQHGASITEVQTLTDAMVIHIQSQQGQIPVPQMNPSLLLMVQNPAPNTSLCWWGILHCV